MKAELLFEVNGSLIEQKNKRTITAGISVILLSSFKDSPRNMQERYQDAMSLVRKFGKPGIFLTMTCNPQCPTIKDNLDGCLITEYRPNLITKTFSLKEVIKDLIQNKIFGNISLRRRD